MERVSSDRVTKAPKADRTTLSKQIVPKPSVQDIATKNTRGRTWLVRSLLAHRVLVNGAHDLKLEWDGTCTQTWERCSKVSEELVSRYIATKARKQATKKTMGWGHAQSQLHQNGTRVGSETMTLKSEATPL